MKRLYRNRWIIRALILGLLVGELYSLRATLTSLFNLSALVMFSEFGLIMFLWYKYPTVRRLIGEDKPRRRRDKPRERNVHSMVAKILFELVFVLVFAAFSIYFLVGDLYKSVPAIGQFSIIAVAPTLGGLVLAAASLLERRPDKRLELIHISQKFISATVLFIIFVPSLLMVDLLHGINITSIAHNLLDPVAWARGIYFWLAVPCFYGGIGLFFWGLWDLVRALMDLGTASFWSQGVERSGAEGPSPTAELEPSSGSCSGKASRLMKPSVNIYFNSPEVVQLYAQLVGWVPKERSKGTGKTIGGELSAGIPVAGASVGGSKGSTSQERYELSIENKLKDIHAYLEGQRMLLHQLSDASRRVVESNEGVFIEIEQPFDAPQFRDEKSHGKAVNDVNQEGSVILECTVDNKCFLLSMGLNHMPRVRNGKMSVTGHEAILIREFKGKAIPLVVFGYLHSAGPNMQIRPITVGII